MGSFERFLETNIAMIIAGYLKVYIARDRADLRKSFQGLSVLVQDILCQNPLSGHLFVFFNKRLDKVKVLYWNSNGFCLWQKRLERGRFRTGSFTEVCWQLTFQELQLLLAGIDVKHLPRRPIIKEFIVN